MAKDLTNMTKTELTRYKYEVYSDLDALAQKKWAEVDRVTAQIKALDTRDRKR